MIQSEVSWPVWEQIVSERRNKPLFSSEDSTRVQLITGQMGDEPTEQLDTRQSRRLALPFKAAAARILQTAGC